MQQEHYSLEDLLNLQLASSATPIQQPELQAQQEHDDYDTAALDTEATPALAEAPAAPAPQAGTPRQRAFVEQYAGIAQTTGQKLGVAPEILLSQWALETGWGKSIIPGTRNLGNIKDSSGQGPKARDNMTGSVDSYRAYETDEDFANDYARLIGGNQRYAGAAGSGDDARHYFTTLKRGGYAEDPLYIPKATSITNTIRQITGGQLGQSTPNTPAPLTQEQMMQALGVDFGLGEAIPDKLQRSGGQLAKDAALSIGQGAAGGIKAITDIFGADNPVSQTLDEASKTLGQSKSEYSRYLTEDNQQRIKEAEAQGLRQELGAYWDAFWDNPAEMVAQGAGSFIPFIATSYLGGSAKALQIASAAKAAGMSKATFLASPAGQAVNRQLARAVTTAVTRANMAMGGAMGLGGVKGSQYEITEQAALAAGHTPEQAQQLAVQAQEYSLQNLPQHALGTALGVASVALGPIEKALSRVGVGGAAPAVGGYSGNLLTRAAKGTAVEMPIEMVQDAQQRIAGNTAAIDQGVLDESQRYTGAAGQALQAGLSVAPLGAAGGVMHKAAPAAAPEHTPGIAPEAAAEATTEAAGPTNYDIPAQTRREQERQRQAQQADPNAPTPQQPLTQQWDMAELEVPAATRREQQQQAQQQPDTEIDVTYQGADGNQVTEVIPAAAQPEADPLQAQQAVAQPTQTGAATEAKPEQPVKAPFDVTHAATAAYEDSRSAAARNAWNDAHITTDDEGNAVRVQPDHFEAWYDGGGVSGDVGSQYDAHGIAKGNPLGALLNLLRNGVDSSRRFDTAPLTSNENVGAGIGTASGGAYKDGPFILLSGRGKTITDNGIETVLVSDPVANVIPALQQEFPRIRFIPYSQAQAELSGEHKKQGKHSAPQAAPTYMPGPAVNANREKAQPQVVLQNRDRSSAASVAQMTNIAANPDFLRVGPSTEMTTGAPVVFGTVPDGAVIGRVETVVDGKDDRIQTQYAVVDAGDVIASNNADGTTVGEYVEGLPGKLRAVAGNGRTAGLQKAYQQGTASQYKQDLVAAAENMGLDAGAIEAMQNPVLVRVMDSADVRDDMGDRTNISGTQRLSPVEQAGNDARRLNLADLVFDENGTPTQETLHQFINTMPDAEKGDLIAGKNGAPTRQAVERLMAAVFKQAYNSDELVDLYAQAREPEARAILNAAAQAAGSLSALQEMNADFDVRKPVADAVKMAVNAARQGMPLAEFAQNADLDTDPDAFPVARFFGQYANKPRQLADGFRNWAQEVLGQAAIDRQNQSQGGLFGAKPTLTRQQLFERLGNANANDEVGTMAREALAQRKAEKAAQQAEQAQAQQPATQEAEGFALTQQTPEELQALHEQQQATQAQEAAQQQAIEDKAQADAQRDSFALTGSDRPADANPNQADLLDAPAQPQAEAPKPEQPKPKNLKEGIKQAQEKRAKKRQSEVQEQEGEDYAQLRQELEAMAQDDSHPNQELAREVLADTDAAINNLNHRKEQEAKAKSGEGKPRPRKGKMGDKLVAGEVVETLSGRHTTPFPKVDIESNRKAINTMKRVDSWLMENALAEAEARGDEFNAMQFRANLKTPSTADKDAAEEYLFGWQPEVAPSALKPLASTANSNTQPKTPITTIRAALTKAYGSLLQKLEAKGLVTLTQTQEEAIDAAAQARAAVTGESVQDVKRSLMESVKNQKAWHGTPHRGIEKTGFELNKIGTGAGQKLYGWGMYFASSKDIAEGYRTSLSEQHGTLRLDGQEVEGSLYTDVFYETLASVFEVGKEAALRRLDAKIERTSDPHSYSYDPDRAAKYQAVKKRVESIDEWRVSRDPGTLYRVEIPEDSDLLDWDKPLSKQPQKVRETVGSAYNAALNKPGGHKLRKDPSGMQFYEWLSTTKGGPQQASKHLQSLGIPGLRYLDGYSAGEGSHNYVIWDEALLTAEAAQIEDHYPTPQLLESRNGAVEGFHDPVSGKTFLIADALTEETAPGTLMHEIGIHMAADSNSKMQKLIARADLLRSKWQGNPFVQQAQERMEQAGETSNEEFLAYVVTQYENGKGKMPITFKLLARDFIAAVRAWLHGKGWLDTDSLSVADLAAIARANAKRLANEGGSRQTSGRLQRSTAEDAQLAQAQRQFAETERAYGGREAYDKAKAADKTKLNYGQWVQVRTPNFKEWFGDWENDPEDASQVVDPATGEPLVVYHGSRFGGFSVFMRSAGGFIYTTPNADYASRFSGSSDGSAVYPAYVSIKKPLDLTHLGERSMSAEEARVELKRLGVNLDEVRPWEGAPAEPVKLYGDGPIWRLIREDRFSIAAKNAGFDGIKINEGDGEVAWVAFESTQIKSATGNRGTFDPANADIRFSRAAQPNYSNYTPAQQQAAQHAFGSAPSLTLRQRFDQLRANAGAKLRQGIADQFAPIKDFDNTAYILARMTKGTDGAVEAAMLYGKPYLKDGVLDVDAQDPDGGFASVLASLKGEHDRFLQWVAAQRSKQLKAQGRENLLTDQDISSLLTLSHGNMADGSRRQAVYDKALRQLNSFNDAVLKVALQSGLIDQAAHDIMAGQPYVPFYRLMEETGDLQGPRFSAGLVNQQAWKRLKGGTEQINADLLQNILQNWASLYSAAARNRAAVATIDAAHKAAIAYPVNPHTLGSTQGVVKVRRNGVQEHWMVEDPHLLDAISAMHYSPGVLGKALTPFKRWLTWGVTISPTFKIRNLIRDTLHSIAVADLGYNPVDNVIQGWKALNKDGQTYASMLASGGIIRFGTQENSNRAREQIAKLGGQLLDKQGTAKLMGQLKTLWSVYEELGDKSENANRAALYQRLLAKGHSHAEAAFMARDLMDFSMSGNWEIVRFLTQTVPFLNTILQGLYKLGRAAKEDPRRFGYVSGAIALASIALMTAYQDDEDWKRREDWDRDANWWFKIGNTAYRIPKPFEVGAIGTVAERTFEWMLNDEMDSKRFAGRISHLFAQTFAMDPTPQALKPILDVYANRDSFTGRSIEGFADERLRPQDRYSERTSEAARLLGQLGLPDPIKLAQGDYEGLSPKQIDHLLRGYFGWVASASTAALDYALRPLMDRGERPALQMRDVFVAGNFIEGLPSGSSRYASALYEQARALEEIFNSQNAAIKEGNRQLANQLAQNHQRELAQWPVVKFAKAKLALQDRKARQIMANKTMTAQQKRQALNTINAERHRIAQQAQAAMR